MSSTLTLGRDGLGFGGYWAAVLGVGDAFHVITEHGLITSDRASVERWLRCAEAEALAQTDEPRPAEWSGFRARVLDELCGW